MKRKKNWSLYNENQSWQEKKKTLQKPIHPAGVQILRIFKACIIFFIAIIMP